MMTKHVVETSLCSRMVNEPDPAPPDPFTPPGFWILSPGIRLGVGEGGRGRPAPVSHAHLLDSGFLDSVSWIWIVGCGGRDQVTISIVIIISIPSSTIIKKGV
jgi:hypothetical protein